MPLLCLTYEKQRNMQRDLSGLESIKLKGTYPVLCSSHTVQRVASDVTGNFSETLGEMLHTPPRSSSRTQKRTGKSRSRITNLALRGDTKKRPIFGQLRNRPPKTRLFPNKQSTIFDEIDQLKA